MANISKAGPRQKEYRLVISEKTYYSEIYDTLWDIHCATTVLEQMDVDALGDELKSFCTMIGESIHNRYERLYQILGAADENPGRFVPVSGQVSEEVEHD